MTDREKLGKAVGLVAWGYIFIYFNINLGPMDILPNFVGYMLILNSLEGLAIEERSTILLKPLVWILIVWEIFTWVNSMINLTLTGYLYSTVHTIVTIVSLYYNFQLFTNLAAIAERYECIQQRGLLVLRTIYTLLITLVSITGLLPFDVGIMELLSLGLVAITVVIIITTSSVLFGFKKSLIDNDALL